MIRAEGATVIAATPRQVLELVLDLDRYRRVDRKIGAVKEAPMVDADGRGRGRYRRKLRGVPTPVGTQDVELERWSCLTFRSAPGVWTRRMTDFEGRFECEEIEGGTKVTHTETFWFKPTPVGWILDALLGRWLRDSMPEEMALLRRDVESAVADPADLR